ncbi:MAG: hypothetical protein HN742_40870 [Lentisphaerae bacterium]|jgi:hypothetical protein|nr:hypothetical protein [Lentisphaerota bacterium]MBT4821458.1 hypothetical protein [Lentisphaerota bacterium]MBT5610155.1 hypothetical protein [Lentisphaerota bacterium]MBT7056959.1 hypothetical protein [Lentisphaerota bacterium]MBT7848289.1 hypothetical protein [Lentisphaerota bacterium]
MHGSLLVVGSFAQLESVHEPLRFLAAVKDDVGAVVGILQAILRVLTAWTTFFVDRTVEAGINPDIEIVIAIMLILTVWLGMACWSSSIASARRYSPKLHFLIGLALPLVYPLVILFAMDVKGARGRQKQIEAEQEAELEEERLRALAAGTEAASAEGAEGQADDTVFDMAFFKRIAHDEDGQSTGPWLIRYANNEVIAPTIVDTLEHAVVIEIHQDGTDQLQRIRIPYGTIASCDLMR